MNLTKVKTNLYKVHITDIPVQDYLGIHIGKDKPSGDPDMPIPNLPFIYVAGKNIKEATDFLTKKRINIISIELIGKILNA